MPQESGQIKPQKCGGCGADLVKSYRSHYDAEEEETVTIPVAKCVSCGREYDQHTEEYYRVFADSFIQDKDNSAFKLGLKGSISGVGYEIIGRLRYQDEDEYERAVWDEWVAVSDEGSYHYFVEEEGEVYSYEEYVPSSIDLEAGPDSFEFEGRTISKRNAYTGRIVFAEGELPWRPAIGEPVRCYDFKKDGVHFTIEHSEDEVSITRGEKIEYDTVIGAFGGESEKDKYARTMGRRKSYKRRAALYLAASVLSLAAAVMNCVTGDEVPGVLTASQILSSNQYQSEGGSASYFSQVLYGPFRIEQGDSLYDVTVFADTSAEPLRLGWESFRLMLVKEERLARVTGAGSDPASLRALFSDIDSFGEPVESYAVTGDFWDEEGRDDEGYWHENDLSASSSFVLDEPGNYYAYLELYNNQPRNPASVRFRIERTSSYRYYLVLVAVFLVLMFVNRSKARSYNELPFMMA
ncbi:MAG: DUF4178 domain-containing protein [Spirochaetes bacterium]|nr:DUF4178 domain-containing protein [Spirochaetota bacterium]